MCWNVHIWETKTREGGKRVLASVLFLCKNICGMTLGGRIFLLLFPFSQHFSVLPHLLLLPHIACSLAELLGERVLSRHREQYLKHPQIPWHSSKPQISQEQHTSSEAVRLWYRFPALTTPSPASGIALGLCWHQACLTAASGLCWHCLIYLNWSLL